MVSCQLLVSVTLALFCASPALAAPWAPESKFATHRTRLVGRGVQLETYHPKTKFETFGAGVEHSLTRRAGATLEDSAASFMIEHLGLKAGDYRFRASSQADRATHVYMRQKINNVQLANAVANIAFDRDNKVISFGNSFVKPTKIASAQPSVNVSTAIAAAEKFMGGKHDGKTPTLEYLARDDDTLALTHVVQVKDDDTDLWVEAFVCAHSGKVLSVTDFYAKATYRVLPISKEVPTEGFEDLTDPEDLAASPKGWHTVGTTTTTTTSGNNVVSFKTSGRATQVSGQTAPGKFLFTQNPAQAPTSSANLNAARVNAFYVVNTMHDITYRYGFTEKAFNFQQTNFEAGGAAGDRVLLSVQDASGTNNANFATPGDGQSGQMRMFTWTFTNPNRDGAFENDIVVHEFTHGVTNRMTGGGSGRCLQTTEAGGMGEGWSDAMADWTEQTSATVKDYVMGQFVTNDAKGIRQFPYSTNAKTNPLRYSSVKQLNEVHNIGEVWANMLHNVYAALVGAHGFAADAKTNPDSKAGNAVFLHLFLDALQLQPCNPTFVSARDSWIQADSIRYAGANKCILSKAFASRGLGVGADNFVDSSAVLSGC